MVNNAIRIDYALAMQAGVGAGAGLTEDELAAEAHAFSVAATSILTRVDAGELGFWRLPDAAGLLADVRGAAQDLPETIRDVLVLGIGGSSLGTRALYEALAEPALRPRRNTRAAARLHLPDNIDPWLLSVLLDELEPSETAVVVISKSGGTLETIAQWLVVKPWLHKALGGEQATKQVIVITDPEKGPLRELARAEGIAALAVPANVGGRFSVLCPVGLLPAALAGIDVAQLLRGAAGMAARCQTEALLDNPAGILAATHVLQHRLRGRNVHVLMPYADRLRAFAAWYVQLWAESLGKRRSLQGRWVEAGPTPLPAVGATDQHAQVQLFMEGPRDKLLTFIHVVEQDRDLRLHGAEDRFGYLNGLTLGQLLDAEREGTTQALAGDGRPSITISVPRLDAEQLGALIFLYEAATAFAGELYGVNTFDQPGVELGKRLAFGRLGRRGYERDAAAVQSAIAARPTKYRV
ncbi:MAG: glucose-6-phosphate isomerase [Proteobacteria bacterium]|nr:glucose-6-phosphate isomerase [Pseudomonadota bacterium]